MKIFIHLILAVSLGLFMLIVFLLMIYIIIVEGYQDLRKFWLNKKNQTHTKKSRLKNFLLLYKIRRKILYLWILRKFRK